MGGWIISTPFWAQCQHNISLDLSNSLSASRISFLNIVRKKGFTCALPNSHLSSDSLLDLLIVALHVVGSIDFRHEHRMQLHDDCHLEGHASRVYLNISHFQRNKSYRNTSRFLLTSHCWKLNVTSEEFENEQPSWKGRVLSVIRYR